MEKLTEQEKLIMRLATDLNEKINLKKMKQELREALIWTEETNGNGYVEIYLDGESAYMTSSTYTGRTLAHTVNSWESVWGGDTKGEVENSLEEEYENMIEKFTHQLRKIMIAERNSKNKKPTRP